MGQDLVHPSIQSTTVLCDMYRHDEPDPILYDMYRHDEPDPIQSTTVPYDS